MQIRRASLTTLILVAFTGGWLLPLPSPAAEEQQIPDDFTFASGEWVEQIERRVDRNAAVLQAILSSMDSSANTEFQQALRTLADESTAPDGMREQARELLERVEQQRQD